MAKFATLSEFRKQTLIKERYVEFRDIAAQMNRRIQDLKGFIEKNGLNEVKSNNRVDSELAELCKVDIEAALRQLNYIQEAMQYIEEKTHLRHFNAESSRQKYLALIQRKPYLTTDVCKISP